MDFEYIKKNTDGIRQRIREAERQAGREEGSVTLLAAVKYADADEIDYLISEAGVTDIGENRVQQLLEHLFQSMQQYEVS